MQLRRPGCPISWVFQCLVLVLLCGCEPRDPPPNPSVTQGAANPPKLSSAQEDAARQELSAERRATRTNQLTAELAAMEAEKAQLLQRREEVNARLTHHQEQGSAMLAKLRTDAQGAAQRGGDEAFKVEARSKVESALAQDDELTDAMHDLDAQIAQIDKRIAELTAQLDAVAQQEVADSDR